MYVIYEMREGSEIIEGPFNSEELQHERAHAEREKSSKGTSVLDYRVSYTRPVKGEKKWSRK